MSSDSLREQLISTQRRNLRALRKKLDRVLLREREALRVRVQRLQDSTNALEQTSKSTTQSAPTEQVDAQTVDVDNPTATSKRSERGARNSRRLPTLEPQLWHEEYQRLNQACDESIARVEARRKSFPKFTYDPELPICQNRDKIKELIRDRQVVVVCGETGCGKSTQLPKLCLELGLGARGLIGHTQPRRIAARSIASRVATEMSVTLGDLVGYKIRFTDQTSERTLVKLMTDGILLAESQNDRFFNQYEVIIVDEAHERSLNVDFLLGIIKRILRTRRDLKLIITSATIDAQRFAEHFADAKGPAPIIELSGRTYPIEILYRPVDELELRREQNAQNDEDSRRTTNNKERELDEDDAFSATLLDAVDELARRGKGDMLLFMPTERDIFETAKLLRGHHIPGDDSVRKSLILPLYARLPIEEQQKIFAKSSQRKIVIATNVAESSLTVPGITYVIDSGTARISRYSARSKTQRLPIEPISQASANQRAGRCGRVGSGVCIRLYSERDYQARPKYTTPEIQRANLASVILQTKALRLGDVEKFPFIDPPRRASVVDGYKTLWELGAVDQENRLTDVGKTLSKIPLDPRIARILLAAEQEGVLRDVLPIAAALEILDPRERPREKQEAADLKHEQFQDENSDFLGYLKLWDFWRNLKTKTTRSQLRKACRENFLSYNRMTEWTDICVQLMQIAHSLKFTFHDRKDDYDAIHRSILAGLLYGVASKSATGNDYLSTGSGKFFLWPGSGLKKKPQWVVAAERLETNRPYLRTVARITPEWIEQIADPLLTRTRSEPFWNQETGCVHAYERVSLYGLTIIPRKRINYGPLDPEKARKIFIEYALVQRQFDSSAPFFVHNGQIEEEAKSLRDKLRQYDFVKSQDMIYDFYDARLPRDVYDATSLKKWLRDAEPEQKRRLFANLSDFCYAENLDESIAEKFPDQFELDQRANLPIQYAFEPGQEHDGLSLVAPLETLRQIDSARLGWLVPGLIEQKVIALLKTLPKTIRRHIAPAPTTAREIIPQLDFGQGRLENALADVLTQRIGITVSPDDFDASRLPIELQFNIKAVDSNGAQLAQSRNLESLREELGVQIAASISAVVDPVWNRDDVTSWDFGPLPPYVPLKRGGLSIQAYPALCDPRLHDPAPDLYAQPDNALALRLFDSQDKALQQTCWGVRRLFYLKYKKSLHKQVKWLPQVDRARVLAYTLPQFDFDQALSEIIATQALQLTIADTPTNEQQYDALASRAAERIPMAVQEIVPWYDKFFQAHQDARTAIEKRLYGPAASAAYEAKTQLDRLVAPGFYLVTPIKWLREFPRYFQAIVMRFDKYLSGGSKVDQLKSEELREFWSRYENAVAQNENKGIVDLELEEYRWAMEEYRVSLFAQRLGTVMKISSVRLDKLWDKTIK
ncbi:MAG: ATP-dependent RNA helicase HrpA [Planctomycetia bacterium]|nr:ATP-dependent RNA helicase HrpA [Planctomycetia bacterium]